MLCVNFRLVIETLRDVDDDRRCFRLVGGVLVERTVKDVLPALVNNKDQVSVYSVTDLQYSKTCVKRPLSKRPKNVFSRPIIAHG